MKIYSLLLLIITFSDVFHYYGLRLLTLIFFSISILNIAINSQKLHLYRALFVMMVVGFIFVIGYFYSFYSFEYFIFPLLVVTGYLLAKSEFNALAFKKYVIVFLLVNLIVLIYEKYTGLYLLDYSHPFSYIQGQGLFGWTKVLGEFLIAMALLYKNEKDVIVLLLLSALLSGVRAASILVFVIFVLSHLVRNSQGSKSRQLNYLVMVSIVGYAIYYLAPLVDKLVSQDAVYRYSALLDSASSIFRVRTEVHLMHIRAFLDSSLLEMLVGKGDHATNLFNWGAESTIIHVMEYYGVIQLTIFMSLMVYAIFYAVKNRQHERMIILTLLFSYLYNWRFGFTFSGIIVWWYIFSKQDVLLRRK